MYMAILYIIFGFILMMISVYLLFKRNEMKRLPQTFENQKHEIENLNKQLDDIDFNLHEFDDTFVNIEKISKKVLSYLK